MRTEYGHLARRRHLASVDRLTLRGADPLYPIDAELPGPRPRHEPTRTARTSYDALMAALLMLGCLCLWHLLAPITLPMEADAPILHITTTVGPPVTGNGHPAHPPTP